MGGCVRFWGSEVLLLDCSCKWLAISTTEATRDVNRYPRSAALAQRNRSDDVFSDRHGIEKWSIGSGRYTHTEVRHTVHKVEILRHYHSTIGRIWHEPDSEHSFTSRRYCRLMFMELNCVDEKEGCISRLHVNHLDLSER